MIHRIPRGANLITLLLPTKDLINVQLNNSLSKIGMKKLTVNQSSSAKLVSLNFYASFNGHGLQNSIKCGTPL